MMLEIGKVLANVSLFAEVLNDAQIERLALRCHEALFPTGAVMMTKGDFGTSMFVVVEGEVSVALADKHGGVHDVAKLSAGEFVGEMSLMTGARRNADVVAESDVVAIEITKVALEEILRQAPDLIDQFGLVLARRQAELDRTAAEVAEANKDDLVSQIRRFFSG